ncbi:MAG TPA: TIGR01777 family oxidoreductase [Pyrinomonadaceae bacterium]|nr:TIGR01777 family oxidoreductase [Pyrinomonadaceae bacterium]
MKIVIAGGTGQVGTVLARKFHARGDEVVILSRKPATADWRIVAWDAENLGDWQNEIDGSDVVINLAGRSVNCRYNEENRRQIMDSRVNSTKVLGEAISKSENPPKVWLQSSTATIYAHRFDAPNDEITGIIDDIQPNAPSAWNFSIDVAKTWERITNEAITPKTRKILMRSAMIMSPDRDGIFDTLLGIVRKGLGGTAGNGKQYISWIHEEDFINSVDWLIEHEELDGAINLAAPNPLPNAEFMRILCETWGTKIGLPAMEWMLEIGAVFMRTETELILKSRRVVPTRMLESGFTFTFPNWQDAAKELCQRWREQN